MRKNGKLFAVLMFVTCLMIWVDHSEAQTPPKATLVKLSMGTTASTSSMYAYAVGAANAVSSGKSGIELVVVESGGTMDNLRRIKRGDFNLGLIDIMTLYEAYNGVATFGSNADPNLRLLWAWVDNPQNFIVRKDSNVNSIYDLSGKKFCAGGRGTATERVNERIFKTLGVTPEYYRGGINDAVDAIKDKRIVGYGKGAGGRKALDANTMDIASVTPIKVLSLSQEDIKKIEKVIPYLPYATVGKNIYEDQGGWTTWTMVLGYACSKDLPRDVAYRLVKAINEGKAHQEAVFAAVKDYDIPELTISSAKTPLHPGAIDYFKELKLEIPKALVPPEMAKK